MGKALPWSLRGNVMPFEFLGGILRVKGGIAKVATRVADDLRLPIACDVREGRGFAVGDVDRDVLGPRSIFTLWVLIPPALLAREAKDQNVRPAVCVEVVGIGKEVFRVIVFLAECALEKLLCLYPRLQRRRLDGHSDPWLPWRAKLVV